MRPRQWKRGWLLVGLVAVLGLAAVGIVWRWGDRLPVIPYLRQVPVTHLGVSRCRADTVVTFHRPDGLVLKGRVYRTDLARPKGALLLFHGNTVEGSSHPFFRILGRRLSDEGYLVLAPDFAGFGESADPWELGDVKALDQTIDIRAALDEIVAMDTDSAPIETVGHSGGAIPSLHVALTDHRVAAAVAIGPGRRTRERLEDPRQLDYFWGRTVQRREALYHKSLPDWYTKEVFHREALTYSLASLIPLLQAPDRPPVLIVEGAAEAPEDLAFTQAYLKGLPPESGAVDHMLIPSGNHYMNVVGRQKLGMCFYDRRTMNKLVADLAGWLDQHSRALVPGARPGAAEHR